MSTSPRASAPSTTSSSPTTSRNPATSRTPATSRKPAAPRHHAARGTRAVRTVRSLATRPLVVLGLAGAGVALVTGAVIGLVGGTPRGSGSAPIADPTPFSVLARPGGSLAPGLSAPATVTVQNPHPRPVVVQSLTADAAELATGDPACDPTVVGFTAIVDPRAAATVPPGAQATFTGSVTMASSAAPACQGASFRIPVRVSVRLS